MSCVKKRVALASLIRQTSFGREGTLQLQACLLAWSQEMKDSIEQTALDKWLSLTGSAPLSAPSPKKVSEESTSETSLPRLIWEEYMQTPVTISCIELTMKHDKHGNVIGWMKEKSRTESWDGSIDNQEKALESHVSKHGWRF